MKIKTAIKYYFTRNLYYKNKIVYYISKLMLEVFK